jgi:hypothetical protein
LRRVAAVKVNLYFWTFQIVEVLLTHGAHIDTRNKSGQRPIDLLKSIPDCKINHIQFTTLKCLAARAVVDFNISYKSEVPIMLEEFIQAHWRKERSKNIFGFKNTQFLITYHKIIQLLNKQIKLKLNLTRRSIILDVQWQQLRYPVLRFSLKFPFLPWLFLNLLTVRSTRNGPNLFLFSINWFALLRVILLS